MNMLCTAWPAGDKKSWMPSFDPYAMGPSPFRKEPYMKSRQNQAQVRASLIPLLLSLLLGGRPVGAQLDACSKWNPLQAVNKPRLDEHYASFPRAQTLPGTAAHDALSYSKSALEAMGLEVQSVTEDVGIVRTKPRGVLLPDWCDCGTWCEMPVSWGNDLATLVLTVEQHGADATVSADFECEVAFPVQTYYGQLLQMEAYRCASRGRQEVEFFKTLSRVAEAHKRQENGPSPPRPPGSD